MGSSCWLLLLTACSFLAEGVTAFQRQKMGRNLVARQDTGVSSSDSTSLTSTSSVSIPTGEVGATPVLFFNNVNNMTVCSPTVITWAYAGPPINMTLIVTNVGVPQMPLPAAPSSTPTTTTLSRTLTDVIRAVPSDVTVILSTKINPVTQLFRWSSVSVPPGIYQASASIASQRFVEESATFYVLQGADTSCLATSSAPPSSNSGSPTTQIPLPVSGSANTMNAGAIIGITLGGLFLIICVIAAYFFIHRRDKHSRSSSGHSRGKGGFGFSNGWNGLSSTDSRAAFNNKSNPAASGRLNRHQSHIGSQGTVLATESQEVIGSSPSEEKLGGGGYNRKSSFGTSYDDHSLVLATLPTLHHQPNDPLAPPGPNGIARAYSTSTAHSFSANGDATPTGRRPSYPETQMLGGAGQRTSLESPYHFAYNPAALNSRSTLQHADLVRSSSLGTSATHQTSVSTLVGQSPSSPPQSPDAKKANRASLGARKTPRKPVPTYELNDVPPSPNPATPSSSPLPPSTLDHSAFDSQTGGNGNLAGHYLTRNNSDSRPTTAEGELAKKSSFGPGGVEGKQLHYLIPDMPANVSR